MNQSLIKIMILLFSILPICSETLTLENIKNLKNKGKSYDEISLEIDKVGVNKEDLSNEEIWKNLLEFDTNCPTTFIKKVCGNYTIIELLELLDFKISLLVEEKKNLQERQANHDLGTVLYSALTEKQFQQIHGNNWVLMDGRNIKNSDLFRFLQNNPDNTNENHIWETGCLPDARGVFLRGVNNGRSDKLGDPSSNNKIGRYQGDAVGRHKHGLPFKITGSAAPNSKKHIYKFVSKMEGADTTESGSEETRPRNVAVNIFVKINR